MKLVLPTHRLAYFRATVARELDPDSKAYARIQDKLYVNLVRLFVDETGCIPHESWIYTEVSELPSLNKYQVDVISEPPSSGRVILDAGLGQPRTLQVVANTKTRIPIVQSPYDFEDTFDRPERYLTFQGWDPDSGLMVFGRPEDVR